jgi:hypothetical protein
MPRSKHRRKPGGKAVRHPGRGTPREPALSPEDVLWQRFTDAYTRPFHEKYEDSVARLAEAFCLQRLGLSRFSDVVGRRRGGHGGFTFCLPQCAWLRCPVVMAG